MLGITVDSNELLLVSIKDTVKNPNAPSDIESDREDDHVSTNGSTKKRRRKRRKTSDIDNDNASEPKTPRTDSEFDHSVRLTPSSARRSLYPSADDSRASFSGQSADGFMLSEMKQDDDDDDDLVEIIKEEPGIPRHSQDGTHIVSIQSLHDPNFMQQPGFGPGGSGMPGGGPPMPGGPMPLQMGDLNEVSN